MNVIPLSSPPPGFLSPAAWAFAPAQLQGQQLVVVNNIGWKLGQLQTGWRLKKPSSSD